MADKPVMAEMVVLQVESALTAAQVEQVILTESLVRMDPLIRM